MVGPSSGARGRGSDGKRRPRPAKHGGLDRTTEGAGSNGVEVNWADRAGRVGCASWSRVAGGWTPTAEPALPTSRGMDKGAVVCAAAAGALPTHRTSAGGSFGVEKQSSSSKQTLGG